MAILHHFEDFDYFVIQGIYYIRFLFASNNFCENMIILLALQPRLQDIIDYLRQLGPQGNISFGASQQKRDLFAGSCYII